MSERRGGRRGRPGEGWEDAEPYDNSAHDAANDEAAYDDGVYDDAAYDDAAYDETSTRAQGPRRSGQREQDDTAYAQEWGEDDPQDWGDEEWAEQEWDDDWDEAAAAPGPREPSPHQVRARAQRRRALATLAVLGLALFFAFWWAYSYYRSSEEPAVASKPTPTCTTANPNALTPAKVTVNVYNATSRKGLAGATAKSVAAQGFVVGTIGNDPLKKKISGPGEVRFGGSGKSGADLVLKTLGSGGVAVDDKRGDAKVDLVLGDGFSKLDALPQATSTLPACPSK